MVEQRTHKPEVVGSSPTLAIIIPFMGIFLLYMAIYLDYQSAGCVDRFSTHHLHSLYSIPSFSSTAP
jgi:hypothetical protein